MIVCKKCNLKKPVSDFRTQSNGKRRSYCKECHNKQNKEWRHKTGRSKTKLGQPRVDLTGKKVGKLTVLENLGTKNNKHRYWLCECECGNIKSICHTHLRSGKIKSCGCSHHKKGKNNPCWKGYGEISGNRWNQITRERNSRPSSKNRKFDISIEEAWNLFLKQNRKCALSGVELYFGKGHKGEYTASLDRIDSNSDYVLDNVQWIHKDINRMKNIYSQEYFLETCKLIAKNNS